MGKERCPLRILMLNHNLRGRGTWHRVWHLGRQLAARGHAVTLWTAAPQHYYRPAREECEGVTMIETPSWAPLADADDGWGPLDAIFRCGRVLFEHFDLCYAFAHPPNVWAAAWLARRLKRRPLLYDWCDWYEGGIFPRRRRLREEKLLGPGKRRLQAPLERCEVSLERHMLRLAGRVTVISTRLREVAIQAGRRPEEVLLLPNGANLDGIRPLDRADCRARLDLSAEGAYLGYVANYHPDQQMLLEALAWARHSVPDLKLLLAGPPLAEPLVRKLELEGNIINLGVRPAEEMGLVLGAADALILPLEDNEHNRARIPYKFTDYLAAGRPVLARRVGDLGASFDASGKGASIGVAAEPQVEAFTRAIVDVMAPGADRVTMGAAARRLAESAFSWVTLTGRLEAFIDDWLKSGMKI